MYATGALSENEMFEVDAMCYQYLEVKNELTLIQNAIESYASKNAIAPSRDLKDKIFNSIDFKDDSLQNNKLTFVRNTNSKFSTFLVAASVTLGILGFSLSLYYYSRHTLSLGQIENLKMEIKDLKNKNLTYLAEIGVQKTNYSAILSPSIRKVKLNALPISPRAFATVFYDSVNKTSLINIAGFPSTSPNKQFQLWAIVKGKPISLGILPLNDSNTLVKTEFVSNPTAFAITAEPQGGSINPSLDQMVSYGAVTY